MSTAEEVRTAIAVEREVSPFPARRAVGQDSGMTLIPLRLGSLVAMLIRLVIPTRKGAPHGTR